MWSGQNWWCCKGVAELRCSREASGVGSRYLRGLSQLWESYLVLYTALQYTTPFYFKSNYSHSSSLHLDHRSIFLVIQDARCHGTHPASSYDLWQRRYCHTAARECGLLFLQRLQRLTYHTKTAEPQPDMSMRGGEEAGCEICCGLCACDEGCC
jgi:hypothetical protein